MFRQFLGMILCLLATLGNTAGQVFTFEQAFKIALQNNPNLKIEVQKSKAARGFYHQSGLYPNPTVLLQAEDIGGSGAFKSFESAETTLSIFQPIPLGNRLYYQQQAAFSEYIASIFNITVEKTRLYIAVGLAYIDTLYAEQWHLVTIKLKKLNEHIVAEIQRRVTAGIGAQLDLKLAQIKLGDAKIQEKQALRNALQSRSKLEQIINCKLAPNRHLTDIGLPHLHMSWKEIKTKINTSPQLKEKILQLKARRANIVSAKKNIWPNLTVQAGARHFSDDDENAAVISVSAPIPVFDANQGNIATAEAQYTQSLEEIRNIQLQLHQNLFSLSLQKDQTNYEIETVSNSLLPLARQSVNLGQDGYQKGLYTYIQLATAINTLYEEEKHYLQSHADNHRIVIQINGLLGLFFSKDKVC